MRVLCFQEMKNDEDIAKCMKREKNSFGVKLFDCFAGSEPVLQIRTHLLAHHNCNAKCEETVKPLKLSFVLRSTRFLSDRSDSSPTSGLL